VRLLLARVVLLLPYGRSLHALLERADQHRQLGDVREQRIGVPPPRAPQVGQAHQRHKPILAGMAKPTMGRKPKNWNPMDAYYETIRADMQTLCEGLGLVTQTIFCRCGCRKAWFNRT